MGGVSHRWRGALCFYPETTKIYKLMKEKIKTQKGFIPIIILIGAFLLVSVSVATTIGVVKYKDEIKSAVVNTYATVFKSNKEITKEQTITETTSTSTTNINPISEILISESKYIPISKPTPTPTPAPVEQKDEKHSNYIDSLLVVANNQLKLAQYSLKSITTMYPIIEKVISDTKVLQDSNKETMKSSGFDSTLEKVLEQVDKLYNLYIEGYEEYYERFKGAEEVLNSHTIKYYKNLINDFEKIEEISKNDFEKTLKSINELNETMTKFQSMIDNNVEDFFQSARKNTQMDKENIQLILDYISRQQSQLSQKNYNTYQNDAYDQYLQNELTRIKQETFYQNLMSRPTTCNAISTGPGMVSITCY